MSASARFLARHGVTNAKRMFSKNCPQQSDTQWCDQVRNNPTPIRVPPQCQKQHKTDHLQDMPTPIHAQSCWISHQPRCVCWTRPRGVATAPVPHRRQNQKSTAPTERHQLVVRPHAQLQRTSLGLQPARHGAARRRAARRTEQAQRQRVPQRLHVQVVPRPLLAAQHRAEQIHRLQQQSRGDDDVTECS